MLTPLDCVFWTANSIFLCFRFACTAMYTCASGSRKTKFSSQNPLSGGVSYVL